MPRALTRKHFHSSKLIRVLSDLALVEACEPGTAFAEDLAQWLNLDDAITLHAVLAAGATPPSARSGASEKTNLTAQFTHLRDGLATVDWPVPATASYEPYRRAYSAHQRDMEASLRPFRLQVREVLARTSPTLAKLAALDAVFDKSLCERERQLLSTLPALLAKRFELLRQAHQPSPADTPDTVNPLSPQMPPAWLTRFGQEMQAVLLAELDARLEPTLGLIEAYNLEMPQPS